MFDCISTGWPFRPYVELYPWVFQKQLQSCWNKPLVDVWKSIPTLRTRLQTFLDSGITKVLSEFSMAGPTLVHCDFDRSYSIPKFLIRSLNWLEQIFRIYSSSQKTNCLTAILDFDFTHIASPADEYSFSSQSIHGLLAGPCESEEFETLHRAHLARFTITALAPEEGKESEVDWVTGISDDVVSVDWVRGVLYLENIQWIRELAALYWLLLDVCPPYFFMERVGIVDFLNCFVSVFRDILPPLIHFKHAPKGHLFLHCFPSTLKWKIGDSRGFRVAEEKECWGEGGTEERGGGELVKYLERLGFSEAC